MIMIMNHVHEGLGLEVLQVLQLMRSVVWLIVVLIEVWVKLLYEGMKDDVRRFH
jgi:hypothetical protein